MDFSSRRLIVNRDSGEKSSAHPVRLSIDGSDAFPEFLQRSVKHSSITVAAKKAVMPPTSWGGLTVLTSKATKLRPAKPCNRVNPSRAVAPPHVGVHTPGAQDGSKKSMSKQR